MPANLLIAAEDPVLAQSLAMLLSDKYLVLLPQSNHRLLREAEQTQTQLIILDDSLEQDPSNLCLSLKKRLPHCRQLYLSSNWQACLALQLKENGVDKILNKPFSTKALHSTINALLETIPC